MKAAEEYFSEFPDFATLDWHSQWSLTRMYDDILENANEEIAVFLEENKKLKAQIKNMQCCGNCRHNIKPATKESILFCCECRKLDETKDNILLTKWEPAE